MGIKVSEKDVSPAKKPLPSKPQKDAWAEKLRLAPEEVLAKAIREMMKR